MIENEITKNRSLINADAMNSDGEGVVVAVLDTGCIRHPFLSNKIIDGINSTNDGKLKTDYMRDSIGHGTQMAGIIAQIAPKAKLLILKFKSNSMLAFPIEALEFAINWKGKNGETVRIINISQNWGNSPTANKLVKEAISKGIIVVAAAGNEGDGDPFTDEICYPAFLEEVISVGSYDQTLNKIASNSNSNNRVDLVAPSRRLVTTSLMTDDYMDTKGWTVASGTSTATAVVSGALALIISKFEKQLNRRLTVEEIEYELLKRTRDIGYDRRLQGCGLLDLSIDADNFGLPEYVYMWHPEKKRLATVNRDYIEQYIKDGWSLDVPNYYERQQMIDELLL
mgnify:FL=1